MIELLALFLFVTGAIAAGGAVLCVLEWFVKLFRTPMHRSAMRDWRDANLEAHPCRKN